MGFFFNKIDEQQEYIKGLRDIQLQCNEHELSLDYYHQAYKKICENAELSDISKTFFISELKTELFAYNVFLPYFKITSYIILNRITDFVTNLFKINLDIIPITFPELYRLLSQIPQDESKNILQQMNISMKTMSGAITAIKNKSESDFISYMESETNNLCNVCKALKVYEYLYSFNSLINPTSKTSAIENEFETLDKQNADNDIYPILKTGFSSVNIFADEEHSNFIPEIGDSMILILKDLEMLAEITPNNYTNDIENVIFEKNFYPDCHLRFTKMIFAWYYRIINLILEPNKLYDIEMQYVNNALYGHEEVKDIVELADRFKRIQDIRDDEIEYYSKINSLEFVIPDDFFHNKMYITESKEDEWLFSICLRPTDDNKKKVQALQTFINTIVENGNIEDNFNTKATFLYRMTGRKLPNTKPGVITWKDEMKNYNCFCYLVKNFEHDFLCQSKGNTRKGLYEKAQGFFGIIGNIDNPSAKANDIQKTKFNIYYEQFKKDMK